MKRSIFILLLIFPFLVISCGDQDLKDSREPSLLRSHAWEGRDNIDDFISITFLPGSLNDIFPTMKKGDIVPPDNSDKFDEQGIFYFNSLLERDEGRYKGVYYLYNKTLILNCYDDTKLVYAFNYVIIELTKDKLVLQEIGLGWKKILKFHPASSK